jgi:hypothetical protein
MKTALMLTVAALMIAACTPSEETIIKQLGACKMQAIEKGFRDDYDYLTACMSTAGYRPSLNCIGEDSGASKHSYLTPACYQSISAGFEKSKKAEMPSKGWGPARKLNPCPDNDPLGIREGNDNCDPWRPKKE